MIVELMQAVEEAGRIVMSKSGTDFEVEYKRNNKFDPVTAADRESDSFLRARIKELFPKDKMLSEENDSEPIDYTGRVWMIDPLDGTKEFVHRTGRYSIIVGLSDNGCPSLGIVYAPASREWWLAERGSGAWHLKDGKKTRIKASGVSSLEEARHITRTPYGDSREFDRMVEMIPAKAKIPEGSSGIKIGRIAQGDADYHINTSPFTCKWDVCGPQAIIEEAGGKITDFHGRPLNYLIPGTKLLDSYVASNGILHKRIIGLISRLMP